jgi:hypothetical protein
MRGGGGSPILGVRSGKSGICARPCAEQGFAGDGEQRPLLRRSRSSPRLKPAFGDNMTCDLLGD